MVQKEDVLECKFELVPSVRQKIAFSAEIPDISLKCNGLNIKARLAFNKDDNVELLLRALGVSESKIDEALKELSLCAENIRAALLFSKYKLLFREMFLKECRYSNSILLFKKELVQLKEKLTIDLKDLKDELENITKNLSFEVSKREQSSEVLRKALALLYFEGLTSDQVVRTIIVGDAVDMAVGNFYENIIKKDCKEVSKDKVYKALNLNLKGSGCEKDLEKYTLRDLRNVLVHGGPRKGLKIEKALEIIRRYPKCIEDLISSRAMDVIKRIAMEPYSLKEEVCKLTSESRGEKYKKP